MNSATIEQLEDDDWGEPDFPSHLVTECHRLRRKPIDEFTIEDHRIMIGQNIGLQFLLPGALEILKKDPLAEGNFYEGDLLRAVMSCEFVQENKDQKLTLDVLALCKEALTRLPCVAAAELFDGYSLEEMGLSQNELDRQVEQRVAEMSTAPPGASSATSSAHIHKIKGEDLPQADVTIQREDLPVKYPAALEFGGSPRDWSGRQPYAG